MKRLVEIFFYVACLPAIALCVTMQGCCNKATRAVPATSQADTMRILKPLAVAVVVDSRQLDGCTFLLRLNDGTVLEPDRLPEKFRHGGRKVLIRYHVVKRMSICMAGRPVVIDHIEFSEVR